MKLTDWISTVRDWSQLRQFVEKAKYFTNKVVVPREEE